MEKEKMRCQTIIASRSRNEVQANIGMILTTLLYGNTTTELRERCIQLAEAESCFVADHVGPFTGFHEFEKIRAALFFLYVGEVFESFLEFAPVIFCGQRSL
jgi:hypothetical protein